MHGYNYGGILQCYALQEALKKVGHTVEIIDFNPNLRWRKLRGVFSSFNDVCGQYLIDIICKLKYGSASHENFSTFRKHRLQLSTPCNSRKSLIKKTSAYDAVIVGSDQVWNLDWFTSEYFLDFAADLSLKRISYAACFGHSEQTPSLCRLLEPWLNAFDKISVRNTTSQAIVKQICGQSPEIVADPTLLVDLSSLAEKPALPVPEYILLYAMSEQRLHQQKMLTAKLREKYKLPVVAIKSAVLQPWDMSFADHCVIDPKIEEWIGLINNASFVLTDSFHGILFAMRAGIPFLNYIGDGLGAARVAYVTDRYGLGSGFPASAELEGEVGGFTGDFNAVNLRVQEHVDESFNYLRSL